MFKKLSSLLLILVIFSSSIFTGTVLAADGEETMPPEHHYLDMASVETYTEGLGITAEQYESLKDTIFGATRSCAANCNISSFSIKYNSTTGDLLNNLIRKGDPETFHVDGISFTTMGSGSSKKFYQFKFTYKYTKAVYDEMREEMIAAADELLEGVEGNNALSDIQKALILHDRLAVYCEYDVENYYAGAVPDSSYTMYGAMVNRICVCEGYTKAYSYLLDRVGIKNYYCSSIQLGHIWNIVYIDGVKYHIDTTWDDPTYDITGYVTHRFFLCSTEKMIENRHNANDFDTTPTATTYDDAFWCDSTSSFILFGNDIYFIDHETGTLKVWSDDRISTVMNVSSRWRAASGGIYLGNFSCLTTDGTYLYYSLYDTVMRYDPISMTSTKMYTYTADAANPGFGIYGIKTEDMVLTVDVYNNPGFGRTTKADYEFTVEYSHPATPGDVNADGKITSKDLAAMKKFIAGNITELELVFCNSDIDSSGSVNSKDLSRLKKLIAQG
ncbi:MAG: hypothetical protein IJT70_04050 [Clostridia bacterium]|nr:hypothetical protein [Clostridia bacterium]